MIQSENIDATVIPLELDIKFSEIQDLESYKLAKYIFPRQDPPPTPAIKMIVTPLQSLEYVVNLSQHKLKPDLKKFWDTVAERNCGFPEISAQGVLCTKYEIRDEIGKYKKLQDKNLYISKLKSGFKPRVLSNDRQLPGCPTAAAQFNLADQAKNQSSAQFSLASANLAQPKNAAGPETIVQHSAEMSYPHSTNESSKGGPKQYSVLHLAEKKISYRSSVLPFWKRQFCLHVQTK